MPEPTLRLLSLGAGVQSTTLALLAAHGELPDLDGAIFADTGWEPASVYEHLDRLEVALTEAGIQVYRVQRENLRDATLHEDKRISMPVFTATRDGGAAPTIRECTRDFKLRPITHKVRELLGYPRPKRVPKGLWVEQWIGFSTDELRRVTGKSDAPYLTPRYPLIELDMDRKACERWLRAHGWTEVAKSACIGCPFHGNAAWRDLRDNRPGEWADAVEFDRQLRERTTKRGLRGEPYLHRSLLPLADAPIDKVSRREWQDRQSDIFDQLEDGDPDGCSPYGCRSGAPVEGARA